jgi:hypothetical protein
MDNCVRVNGRGSYFSGITLGLDTEFFVEKNKEIVSARDLLKNDSDIIINSSSGKIVRDGFSIEVQPDSSTCLQTLKTHIYSLWENFYRAVPDYSVSVLPITPVTIEQIRGDEILGCSPEWSGVSGERIPIDNELGLQIRTNGGHMHFGINSIGISQAAVLPSGKPIYIPTTQGDRKKIINATKALDTFVGLLGVIIEGYTGRKRLYGKASSIRMTRYGLEYRTLSNVWMLHTMIYWWMFSIARTVFLEGIYNPSFIKLLEDEGVLHEKVTEAINSEDREKAFSLWINANLAALKHVWKYNNTNNNPYRCNNLAGFTNNLLLGFIFKNKDAKSIFTGNFCDRFRIERTPNVSYEYNSDIYKQILDPNTIIDFTRFYETIFEIECPYDYQRVFSL